jgi:glycosyltransferase involved in cell wall biosynthesis
LYIVRALLMLCVQVALATMGLPMSRDQRAETRGVRGLEVFESRFKLEWMQNAWDDVSRAGQWLLNLEEEISPQIIHLNGFVHGALPWRAPVLVVGHSCVLSWWKSVRGGDAPESWTRYRKAVQAGLNGASMVVAPTGSMLLELDRIYGLQKNTRIISNGRTNSHFVPVEKENFILTVGRLWDEAKNVMAVEKAAEELSWPVYVAGESEHPEGGTACLRNLCFLGRLPPASLAGWFNRASIYALPARYEPFGLTVLEAALAGCALVLGDIPTLREIWEDAALYVPPDDAELFKGELDRLIRDPVLRAEMGKRSKFRAIKFTPELMAHRYLEAYSELIENKEVA